MRFTEIIYEAGSNAQRAAIAIAMKKAGKKPKTESYAMEDEQIDGMAQGEIREIIKNAIHIKNQLDKGVSLDGWMYSFVTVSNDKLNSVAEQINNPNIEEQGISEGSDHFHPNDILDEAAPWVNKLGLGNFFRKVQGVDADNQSNIRILSGVNHSMQLYFKTIMAMNASVGPTAALFWPLLGKQALMFVGGALVYTVGKILAGKAGRAVFGSADEALAFAKAHLAAAQENNKTSFEFDGKTYPVTVKDPNAIAKLEQQLGDLEQIVFAKKTRAAQADYNKSIKAPKSNSQNMTAQPAVAEEWSQKYKSSINCSHPKGFSQKAHCAGKKKHNESIEMEMTCPDCGMCQTHGDHSHDNLDEACWKGYHKEGNKKMFGKTYPNCVKNEDIAENDLDKYKKYTRPSVKTTPKIERTTNPSGRTTDHVEYKVTSPTGEIHRYKSKKQAQEYFDSFGQQGVAEDKENYNGINILLQKDDDELFVKASAGSRELGHVLFVIDGEYLMPQDLEVEEKFRGQGIAQTMYDYVKSKGYKIRRSGQQTDAGAGFWDKHRPEQNVWEQGVAEEKKPDFMKTGNMKPFKVSGEEIPGAVRTLEKVLLKAKERDIKLNYTNIDKMMQAVCQKHNLTGDELHNEFVSKHHMIPDDWIVKQLDENLHQWFKEKWVRFGPDGKIRGDCARGSESEGKPKCLPQSKAHSLGKKGRASAASRKRREDPNANRSGKAINVSTKGKGK